MQPHILILGAGIMGAALTHRLACLGAAVTCLDAGLPAGGASGRSFGWVNASFFLSEPHFHLRHAAMRAHQALARELGLPLVVVDAARLGAIGRTLATVTAARLNLFFR
jgi:glycine/D-amino acid oxidase-like deaminating enzyme